MALRRGGFTLLEVVFAVGIIATALLALMAGVSGSISSAGASINRRAAREVCRAKLEEILAGSEGAEGAGEVEDYPGFRWSSRTDELKIGVADRSTETVKVVTVEVTFPVDSQNQRPAADGSSGSTGSTTDEGMETISIASIMPPEEQPQEGTGQ
jgi:type II secretory pathway pseudopilin PulG